MAACHPTSVRSSETTLAASVDFGGILPLRYPVYVRVHTRIRFSHNQLTESLKDFILPGRSRACHLGDRKRA